MLKHIHFVSVSLYLNLEDAIYAAPMESRGCRVQTRHTQVTGVEVAHAPAIFDVDSQWRDRVGS